MAKASGPVGSGGAGRGGPSRGRWKIGIRAAVVAALLAVVGVLVAPVAAGAASSAYCGITWGSLAKQARTTAIADSTTGVRSGRHTCYDRLVIDGASWARVRYVDQVRMDGSGKLVPLQGGAKLQVITTTGFDPGTGAATYQPSPSRQASVVDVTGYRTFRQVAWAGDFEGQLTIGVGVRARLPFRVFVLQTAGCAPRVVVDVGHRW